MVCTVEFDAEREVVAVFSSSVLRLSGMPSAFEGGDVLRDCTVAGDEEVRADAQIGNVVKVGMYMALIREFAQKEGVNVLAAEIKRRQADVVQNAEADVLAVGAFIVMRRGKVVAVGGLQPALGVNKKRLHVENLLWFCTNFIHRRRFFKHGGGLFQSKK